MTRLEVTDVLMEIHLFLVLCDLHGLLECHLVWCALQILYLSALGPRQHVITIEIIQPIGVLLSRCTTPYHAGGQEHRGLGLPIAV